jgi:hypothetical protein
MVPQVPGPMPQAKRLANQDPLTPPAAQNDRNRKILLVMNIKEFYREAKNSCAAGIISAIQPDDSAPVPMPPPTQWQSNGGPGVSSVQSQAEGTWPQKLATLENKNHL